MYGNKVANIGRYHDHREMSQTLNIMKNSSFYNEFIRSIEELYSSITMRILQKRMDSYHSASAINTGSGNNSDFSASLYKYIDDVSHQAKKPTSENQTSKRAGLTNSTNPYPPAHFEVSNKGINSGLTKHFREIDNAERHPGISGKLKDSIWEHVHSSIRCARQGDAHAAKMHADIANNAYKELSHYLTDEEHSELAREIEEEFDTLVNKNKADT